MEFVLGIVRALRSLRAAHGLTRQRPPCTARGGFGRGWGGLSGVWGSWGGSEGVWGVPGALKGGLGAALGDPNARGCGGVLSDVWGH